MIKNISVTLATILVTTAVGMGSAAALDDRISLSGVTCTPKRLSRAEDFRYGAGAIINRSSDKRKVVCSILRDRYSAADGEEVDSSDVELALTENMAGGTPRMAIHYLEEDGSGAGSAVVYLARKGYGLMP